jgi:hypothetical protein
MALKTQLKISGENLYMRTRAFVGWFISLSLTVGIAGPLFGTCTQGSDDPWMAGLFFFGSIGLIGLLVAWTGAPAGQRYLWFATPHIITLGLMVYLVPNYLMQTTFGDSDVCSVREGVSYEMPVSMLQRLWAPAWLIIAIVLILIILQYWRGLSGQLEIGER